MDVFYDALKKMNIANRHATFLLRAFGFELTIDFVFFPHQNEAKMTKYKNGCWVVHTR